MFNIHLKGSSSPSMLSIRVYVKPGVCSSGPPPGPPPAWAPNPGYPVTFPGVLSLTWPTLQYREKDLFLLCDLLVWQLHCLCYACWQLQCLPQSTQDFSLMTA